LNYIFEVKFVIFSKKLLCKVSIFFFIHRLATRKVYQKEKKKVGVVILKNRWWRHCAKTRDVIYTSCMSQDGIFRNKIDLSQGFSKKHHITLLWIHIRRRRIVGLTLDMCMHNSLMLLSLCIPINKWVNKFWITVISTKTRNNFLFMAKNPKNLNNPRRGWNKYRLRNSVQIKICSWETIFPVHGP
jgi:hypothetical protein